MIYILHILHGPSIVFYNQSSFIAFVLQPFKQYFSHGKLIKAKWYETHHLHPCLKSATAEFSVGF